MKITLCGSLSFNAEMLRLRDELTAQGHDVLLPESALTGQSKEWWERYKTENHDSFLTLKAERMHGHFDKIFNSDTILVANYPKHNTDGYIGTNTLMEIGVAFHFHKKIFLLFPPPINFNMEELAVMGAVILSGDLSDPQLIT